jgi:hypothetical protein
MALAAATLQGDWPAMNLSIQASVMSIGIIRSCENESIIEP